MSNDSPIVEALEATTKEESEKPEKEVLQEFSLSWAGKVFFAGVAAYLTGVGLEKLGSKSAPPKLPFKIRGTPAQIQAVISALMASKSFQQELKKPGATVESVIDKLNLRNMTKDQFKKITGRPWPI